MLTRQFFLLMLICLGCIPQGNAQTIVNTETLLAQVDSGWAATFGVVGDLSYGNSRVTDLATDGSVGLTQGNMTYRLAASWARLAQDGAAIQDNRFAQLRVNRKLGSRGWQVFAFLQTASNNVLLMQERTLLGAGVRKRVLDGDGGWFDVGWGPFSEREVYNAETQGAWHDNRFYYESAANMAISERLSFEFSLVYRRDSKPHADLESVDMGTAFGLRWEFE